MMYSFNREEQDKIDRQAMEEIIREQRDEIERLRTLLGQWSDAGQLANRQLEELLHIEEPHI
jgi:uncharacterized protein YjgD (DUF1641 family)